MRRRHECKRRVTRLESRRIDVGVVALDRVVGPQRTRIEHDAAVGVANGLSA